MNGVVAFALKQRVLMVGLFLFALAAGVVSFTRLNIEAYPDPVPPLVEVITQAPGQAAEEIERYFTIPLEIQMEGIPNVTAIRTISLFGLSDVRIFFNYNFTYEQAEQWVINRLSQMSPLPNGASPQISPTSPIGEIYRYRIEGPPGYSVTDLKTLQDWVLERRFKAVPGVIDVSGWAGKTKTYAVTVDLDKLLANGLTLPGMLQSLNNSNVNVGGQTINLGPQAAIVRGVGLVHTMDDLRHTMLTVNNGVPITVKDVASVEVGHQPRLGIVGQDADNDIVQGIVLMRRGEQSLPTIRRVEAEVEEINNGGVLPPGVRLVKIYDRRELINVTTRTVLHNMVFGIVLIFFVQWLFLGDLRSAVVVAATLPFALFFAVSILVWRGELANLLSVGAIDFGLVVDATVILVENVCRHLAAGRGGTATRPARHCPAFRAIRQIAHDPARGGRGQFGDLLRGSDHHCRLCPAVHPVRRRRSHFRPDGQDLCLCHPRRAHCHLHRLAGLEFAVAARRDGGDRDLGRARLRAASTGRFSNSQPANAPRHCSAWRRSRCWRSSRWESSASNFCRISRKAISGSAPPCRRRSRSRRPSPMSTGCGTSSAVFPRW